MEQTFLRTLATYNINLNQKQLNQFEQYYQLLIEWNAKMNLTAITDKDLVYNKHFLDSASLAFFYDLTKVTTLCDVGSGAGFPSLVLKILYPHLKITIIEALNKRLVFLQHLIEVLGLTDVTLVHERAEDYGKKQREQFDVVTARAVARLRMLAELCVPLVKKNGVFIAMKGSQGESELQLATTLLTKLGITEIVTEQFMLKTKSETEKRLIYICKKGKHTPQSFPRPFAQIKKDNSY